jgi:hypothetical protein
MPQLWTPSTRKRAPDLRQARPSAPSSARKPGANVTEETVRMRVRASIASIIACVSIAPFLAGTARTCTPRSLRASQM